MSTPVVEMSGVAKRFGGVVAVRHVDLELFPGEVHALLGENGAGKSTLVNMLAGVHRPDAGTIAVDGTEVTIPNPRVSRSLGISVVHQHPVTFPDLTVAENIMLAGPAPRRRTRLLDRGAVRRHAREALARLDVRLDISAEVKLLSAADQQLLEIAKALDADTRLLVLDEPTAALSTREVDRLMEIIARLKADGVAVLFVGHRLNEVFALADRVSVSRDGATVVSGPAHEFTPESAVGHMVGRSVETVFPKADVELGPVRLEVRGLGRRGAYTDVSFTARRGEILGLAGLVGAGRTEIAHGLFGLEPADTGEILLDGIPVDIATPQQAMRHGIAYVPEDRQSEGVVLEHSIAFNLPLALLERRPRFGLLSPRADRALADDYIERLGIRTSGPDQLLGQLSGGNQQKVVIAKWLATDPSVLILDDPTKGIDVGAKAEVHRLVSELAGRGLTILLISNELEELLSVSDRVVTFYRGAQGPGFDRRPFDAGQVLAAMTGQVADVHI
ncbi:sugar ABC transporter ATP-binding protein [Pseudonocardia alni]|uniref:sugar ABC transporter ATP-binding protein n=1 Tax=Pseudonocardia TaxID=1847 RepID=UPI000917E88F|nr:ATP-binding cassette domain-containing protein [Pseudonocardia sp. SID8383]OJG08508.1 Ribose import ATP-binding protein RbsA [Pseudonocardia autotrophica]